MTAEFYKWTWEADHTRRKFQIRVLGSNEHVATVNNLPPEKLATRSPEEAKLRACLMATSPEMFYQLERINGLLIELTVGSAIAGDTMRRRVRMAQEAVADLLFRARPRFDDGGPRETAAPRPMFDGGSRWVLDKHAMPGRPFAFLDRDPSGNARATLVEVHAVGSGIVFEARDQGGKSIVVAPTAEQAAKLAEAHVLAERVRQRSGLGDAELIVETLTAYGGTVGPTAAEKIASLKSLPALFYVLKHQFGEPEEQIEQLIEAHLGVGAEAAARRS